MVLERTANPWSLIRLVGSSPTLCVEERSISFRASRTFVDLHLLLAARMILLRTEHDRPAVLSSIYPTMLEVKLNPYPLMRNDRDRRCRSEARRLEHSLVCERSVVRILPLRWCRADVILYALCGRIQRVWSEVSAHMPA